ncbi:MAG: DUF6242 domain-containing protein [Paludibacteraceae bacterium]|nr:DUF6242 domain-containing protein [Paludibacteraceae bacterium]
MRKGIAAFFIVLSLILVGCKETTLSVISSRAVVANFGIRSRFDSSVKEYYFTIDTVNHLIYNEDSLGYGTKIDSLTPYMTQTFAKVVFDDTINFYVQDTVYLDFSTTRKMTVTSSSGDTASYFITVNVHTVPQDSFVWNKSYDLGAGVIEKQRAVMTDDEVIYWMMKSGGQLGLMSSTDGVNWVEENVTGLPQTVDLEHLIAFGDEINVLDGNDLYSYDGESWAKSQTTSNIELRHLLFTFNGEMYALGKGNVILKLEDVAWKTAAELQSGFPVTGECAFVCENTFGSPVAYVACGIDETGKYLPDVWSSENGSHWVKLNIKETVCTPRANAAVIQYGKGLLMIGGTTKDSLVEDRMLFSKDYGMTWQDADTVYKLDTNNVRSYSIREGLSMVKKGNGEVFVIGGRDSVGVSLGDVWLGLHYASIPGFKK